MVILYETKLTQVLSFFELRMILHTFLLKLPNLNTLLFKSSLRDQSEHNFALVEFNNV